MSHPLRTPLLALALVWVSLGAAGFAQPSAAHAVPMRVLGLHVDGEKLSAKDRTDLFAVMQAKLRLYPDVELKNPPAGELTDEMIDLECVDLDATCLARLGKKYEADKVVHVEVSTTAGRQVMRVRFIDVALVTITRDREVKADKVIELASVLELEVETVFGKPPAPVIAEKPGLLVIDVDSPDAIIQLGAEYIGTGTATSELAPGEYTVRITQKGFQDIIKKLVVKGGQTTQESFRLVAIVGDLGPGTPKKPKGKDDDELDWVIWAIVGAVVVGGAVAVVALTTGGSDDVARGPAVLGIDGTSAWRDPATIGGRR